jgi:REP element-mobilizing transposase RayT
MARKVRIQYPGAIYHVMSRGARGEAIFEDDADRERLLETLTQACQKTGWQVHAYCLMGNHFHLVLETPQPNLVEQVSVPTIDTFGCARFHSFGNGKPQKRAGPATRERRKPWRRQAPPFPESVIHRELAFQAQIPRQSPQRVLETWSMPIPCAVPNAESDGK